MMARRGLLGVLLVAFLPGCAHVLDGSSEMAQASPEPPRAPAHPHELVEHGHERTDDYYWLRDDQRENPEVLGYLEAENAYTKSVLRHTEDLQETLYQELIERIDPDESTVPVRHGEWWYSEEYEKELEYPRIVRSRTRDGDRKVILDVNELAQGHDFFEVASTEVSPNGRWLAYAVDTVGRGQYTVYIKDLESGETLSDELAHASASLAWAADNETLFYIRLEEQTLIPRFVYRHTRGQAASEDALVYKESDPTFFMGLGESRSGQWIVVQVASTLSTEVLFLPTEDPTGELEVVLPREARHEYFVEPLGEDLFILSNWDAENFRVFRVPVEERLNREAWTEVVPHREDVFIADFAVFDRFLVTEEMDRGTQKLRVVPLSGDEAFEIESDEPAYTATIEDNPNTDTDVLRYGYSSLATADVLYEIDLGSGERNELKRKFVGSGYQRDNYVTQRFEVTARDGVAVPVTLLYRKGVEPDGTNPLYVLGYGSYGSSYEPEFAPRRLSLVDRGFVFALAHIRGGQELGRRWYEDGKLLRKKNTFTDFIDVTTWLVENGWGDPDKVVGTGRSAGGLLIGAVANMAPERFTALVAGVPFVDVVTTMLDESIPLTTFEFDEWGNPKDEEYYEYMLSYSPYDQVEAKSYPHMLVTAGLWDPAVQYWEPAKWVAKLRVHKTGDEHLLLYTDMKAGHRGSAARFKRMRDRALEYAFLFDLLGIES